MDWYALLKFLHVSAAVVWVGGGFTLMVLALRAERAGDIDGMLQSMRATADLGNRVFVPASLLTLVFGLIMCWFWVGFSDLWIVIGLVGFASTFLVGILVFKPTSERMTATVNAEGPTPAVLADGRRLMRFARFDYAVMLVVVADMVLKPTPADLPVLVAMAIALVAGSALAFGAFRDTAQARA